MSIYTNFFPIQFQKKSIIIPRLEYSSELLNRLRNENNQSQSFFRNEEFIYVSSMTEKFTKGDCVNINVDENDRVVSSLIKHIFFRTFRDRYSDIVPLSFYPFRFLSRNNKDDLIFDLLEEDLQKKISYKKLIEIQFREIENNNKRLFGAVISISYQWIFNKNCKELKNEGYDFSGVTVTISEPIPGLDGIIAPDETLIGTVDSINGDFAEVNTNNGVIKKHLSDLFIQKTTHNIIDYLEFKIGQNRAQSILSTIKTKDILRFNAKNNFDEIGKIAKQISKLEYKNLEGFSFQISDSSLLAENKFNIFQPNFLFDYNPGSRQTNPSSGLNLFGPYDSASFDIKNPEILIICHKNNRGAFTEFCGKLFNGIPTSKTFKKGLKGKYELQSISFTVIELDNYSTISYLSKIKEYFQHSSKLPDLAIIETCDDFKRKDPKENPYFLSKSYFLSLGIPVQFIRNEKIRLTDLNLQWILESVALQIYAKLGGTPWVLQASNSIDHELIIGIGSAITHSNMYTGNTQKRIVGITTFFTGDGKYIFGNRSKEVSYEEYFQELLHSLQQSLLEISSEYGWKKNSSVRIIFHIFKPIKNIESEVIQKLIDEFPDFSIKYSFVTISEYHPYLLFDTSSKGNPQEALGVYVPDRGQNWIIDERSCVLQLKGAKDIKTIKHNFSNPVLIKIHEKSTYVDLNTIVQQIYNFTYLSWRGFSPAQQPVTILYSDLIAHQLSNLGQIDTWKPEIIHSLLKSKKWFL